MNIPIESNEEPTSYEVERILKLRSGKSISRPDYLTTRGRLNHGPTPPGGSLPAERETDLTPDEVDELIALIVQGRHTRTPVHMPERLRARSWKSVEDVILRLNSELGWEGAGWKVGAASQAVRKAENVPSPSPGHLFKRSIFKSPAVVPSEFFVNYRLCEFEFAYQLGESFPARDKEYTEADLRAGIECLMPVIEIGDSVFEDWYSLSGYFGGMYDNAGGAAFVTGRRHTDWEDIDLPQSNIDVYVNDFYIKSGIGIEAMGHPLTSLTWMVNWVRERGRDVNAGELVSTGTCTAHTFVQPGDLVSADFTDLGLVEAKFV